MTSDVVVSDLMLPLWEEVLCLFLDAWDGVRLPTTATQWNVPGRCGPYGDFFFLAPQELVRLGPSIRPHGELQRGLQLFHRGSGSEASDDDQADNVSTEALYVIALPSTALFFFPSPLVAFSSYTLLLALGCIRDLLLNLSRLLARALRPFAPALRCHRGFFATLEAGTCAGSRA